MDGDATAQEGDAMTDLRCEVHGVVARLPPRVAAYDLDATPLWRVPTPLGPRPLSDRALDLLDLAGGVYRVESRIKRRATDPAVDWRLTAPVRDIEFWRTQGGPLLGDVLSFLNRGRWRCDFVPRPAARPPELAAPVERNIQEVILFSGGMDSLCGAGVHQTPPDGVALVGCYHKQAALQIELGEALGYPTLAQWRLAGQRGKEGMNLVRSFMFLTLGAVTAETYGASKIYQYENGVLALAIPPAGNFIPTRHAHPETHRRVEALFAAVFGRLMKIANPFVLHTKRETVADLLAARPPKLANALLDKTETCWYGIQAHVGGVPKTPWQPCGVCTPCLVRRTARPQEIPKPPSGKWRGYAFDLRKPADRERPKLGISFRGYLELIDIVAANTTDAELIAELAPEARALIGRPPGPREADVVDLLRRFAAEFRDTYGIAP